MNFDLVDLVVRLVFGSIAAFAAILLWSKTRDAAWLFIIVSSTLFYGVIVYDALVYFGALAQLPFGQQAQAVSEIVLRALPYVFLTIGFIAAVRRRS